jgi:hypothetical protein
MYLMRKNRPYVSGQQRRVCQARLVLPVFHGRGWRARLSHAIFTIAFAALFNSSPASVSSYISALEIFTSWINIFVSDWEYVLF